MTDFNPFQAPPLSVDARPPEPAPEKKKRGPRRVPGAKVAKNKPGRPRKDPQPVAAAPSPIDLPKIVAAVAGLDQTESQLVVNMAQSLNNVTPYQAVRIACALGKLFS